MKNLYIAIIAFFAITIVSCEKNEGLLIPQNFSDFAYTLTDGFDGNAAGDTNYVESPTVVSFMHLSQGSISHEWTIDEGVHFLSSEFDDDTEDYTPFIKEGTKTKENIAFVLLEEAGMHKVTLRSFFADSVAAYSPSEFETYTCFWNEEKAAYEMKVDFIFKVMEDVNMSFDVLGPDMSTVLTSVSLDQTGNADPSSWPIVELIEGDSITIKFTEFKGDPIKVDCFHEAGVTTVHKDSATLATTIIYRTPGKYKAGTVILYRHQQGANQMPPSEMEKTIPLHIVVKEKPYEPSPILFNKIVATTSNSLTFQTKEIAAEYIQIGENAKNDFAVAISNTAAGVENKTIAVSSVTVEELNITLTFAENIYSDDFLNIVYTDNGNITDDKQNQLQNFRVNSYDVPEVSVINDDIYDFEKGAWALKAPWTLDTDNFKNGATSLKFNNTKVAPSGLYMADLADQGTLTTPLVAGEVYELSFWVYIEEGCDVEDLSFWFKPATDKVIVNVSELSKGQWVECKANYTCKTASTDASIIHLRVSKQKKGVFYIDDINLTRKNSRPL